MDATRTTGVSVAVLALVVVIALGLVQRDIDHCQTVLTATGQTLRAGDDARFRQNLDGIAASCPGSESLGGVAAGLYAGGENPEAVLRLAREAARREPESYVSWATVAVAARDSDPVLARAARRRALALNPMAGPSR